MRRVQRLALGEPCSLPGPCLSWLGTSGVAETIVTTLKRAWPKAFYGPASVPNVVSVPYYSFVVQPDLTPTDVLSLAHRRRNLISIIAGVHGQSSQLRAMLLKQCAAAGREQICKHVSLRGIAAGSELVRTKVESVFCMEPSGDWPVRAGVEQDFLLGCIPVIFSMAQLEQMWTSVWTLSERARTVIFIDENDIISRRVDPVKFLSEIPRERIQSLQREGAHMRSAFAMLYANGYIDRAEKPSLSAFDCADDAFTRVLRRLVAGARVY